MRTHFIRQMENVLYYLQRPQSDDGKSRISVHTAHTKQQQNQTERTRASEWKMLSCASFNFIQFRNRKEHQHRTIKII